MHSLPRTRFEFDNKLPSGTLFYVVTGTNVRLLCFYVPSDTHHLKRLRQSYYRHLASQTTEVAA
mgnify:CR=1 FL=1|jgi:hypothetical protein